MGVVSDIIIGLRYLTDPECGEISIRDILQPQKREIGTNFEFYPFVLVKGDFKQRRRVELYIKELYAPGTTSPLVLREDSYIVDLIPGEISEKQYLVPVLLDYPSGFYNLEMLFYPEESDAYLAVERPLKIEWLDGELKVTGEDKIYHEGDELEFTVEYSLKNYIGTLPITYDLNVEGVAPEDYYETYFEKIPSGELITKSYNGFTIRHLRGGYYPVKARVTFLESHSHDRIVKGGWSYYVLPAELRLSLLKNEYQAGEVIQVKAFNSGGG